MQNILENSYLEQKMVGNSYLEVKDTATQLFRERKYWDIYIFRAKIYWGTAI